ncbi:hypothetical protein JCM3770_007302 [Rhodotorula araucariae]
MDQDAVPAGKVTDFAPRKTKPQRPKKAPTGEEYRDRAAERRAGRDGDFADAEKMLHDLKSRETFSEEQLQYLGGDAHHSVLVKGLDHALLARKKHEAALQADAEPDDVEDALDEAFVAAAPAPAPASAPKGGARKSRDELLAELKALRAGSGSGAAVGAMKGVAPDQESRFKPIGADRKGKGKEGAAGAGWKAVGAAAGAGDGAGDKKKRRKKKVAPAAPTSAAAPGAPTPPAEKAPSPPPALVPLPPAVPDFDDNGDIFGDVGEYAGGLGTDSESESDNAEPRAPAPAEAPASVTGAKRKYFDDEDEPGLTLSTAPDAVTDLAARQAAADAAAAAAADLGDDGDAVPAEGAPPVRLQGLSGSRVPSARELLDMDKEVEAEEKRKAKKAKRREKAEERERSMTDADRSNRDFLEMQAYLKRKEGKGGE